MDHQLAIEIGRGLAIAGAGLAVGLGCSGSAKGIGIASKAVGGVLSEKPDLFGRLLVLLALPGTQGFYGFITAILIFVRSGLITGEMVCTPGTGLALFVLGLGVGLALFFSATWQGEASAASIALVARRPEAFGRSIILPAMVETYAVVALLVAILAINWLTAENAVTAFIR
ncbi:MAG TPA: V-type ATP synthase subunit K [Candidatus Hydrogenedentes bacterium]|nr:V-type ATP synthase subunit K [Candidatus Hydrogenedentota bacterium]HNT87497.1 V-type ATP synthase subunit K [Candidatus Hydrogenedentota bacterium]